MQKIQFDINRDSPQPIYSQIVEQVRFLVDGGRIAPGSTVPTTRGLAQQLGVHRNTIIKAYDELRSTGYLRSLVGSGTVVANPRDVKSECKSVAWTELMPESVTNLLPNRKRSLDRGAICFSTLNPSDELLPTKTFEACLQTAAEKYTRQVFSYTPPAGIEPLREIVAKEMRAAGMQVDAKHVVITSGATQAIDLASRLLVKPGSQVLVEDPTYHRGLGVLKVAGARLVPLPGDKLGPNFGQLPQTTIDNSKVCYLIPSFRNPTGTTIDSSRRQEIGQFIEQNGMVVIEDDYGFELNFSDSKYLPLKGYAPANVFYIGSFSKRTFPSLRIGYIIAPDDYSAEKLIALKSVIDVGNSAFLQYALVEFIMSGAYAAHIEKLRTAYAKRKEAMQNALSKYMPSVVAWNIPEGGLFFWLTLPESISFEELMFKSLDAGVSIAGGSMWSATGAPINGVRLLFCSETEERIERGVKLLAGVLERLLKQSEKTQLTSMTIV